jgi:hypothetical protein
VVKPCYLEMSVTFSFVDVILACMPLVAGDVVLATALSLSNGRFEIRLKISRNNGSPIGVESTNRGVNGETVETMGGALGWAVSL